MSPVVDALVVVRKEMVVVARVEVPDTARVPCEVSDVVAVIDPPVMVETVADRAERSVVKKLVVVADVKTGVLVKV